MKIIDGDRFQKENKQKELKDNLSTLIGGILLTIIALMALFIDDAFFLKVIIIILPVIMIMHALRKLYVVIKNLDKVILLSEIVQITLTLLIALYILLNPIGTLAMLLQIIGGFLLVKALLSLLLSDNYPPVTTIVIGLLLILFAGEIIGTLYTIFFALVLVAGVSMILKGINQLKK